MSSFSFISSEGILVGLPPLSESTFRRSIFLESALSAGSMEGMVPVARATALRWYVAYLVYWDWMTRLFMELHEEEKKIKKCSTSTCEKEKENKGKREIESESWEGLFNEDVLRSGSLIAEESLSYPNSPLETTRRFALLVDSFTTSSTESMEGEVEKLFEDNESPTTTFNTARGFSYSRRWQREDGAGIFHNRVNVNHPSTVPFSFSNFPSFSTMLDAEDICNSLNALFLENVVLQHGTETDSRRVASYFPLHECEYNVNIPTFSLSAVQQERLLQLLTTADYLGDAFLTQSCARYFISWLMQVPERDLLASFIPTNSEISKTTAFEEKAVGINQENKKEGSKAPYHAVDKVKWCVPSSTSLQSSWLPLPSSFSSTSVSNSSLEGVSLRKKSSEGEGEGCVHPEKMCESNLSTPSMSDSDELCLSADQRLVLLAEVKRTNATFVEPYW
ncbi:unnamed protein product [Phytomonas sp. Hart1]|nr:unnamed protein product [Phytomonas sp. Hart1]|eukprot:CCW71481.1 unnamed protein product [Phytomonas sp. isolate Hart1]